MKIRTCIKENRWLCAVYFCIACLIALGAAVIYQDVVQNAMSEPRSVLTVRMVSGEAIPLTDQVQIEQDITMVSPTFTGISVWLEERDTDVEGELSVSLLDDSGQLVEEWTLSADEIKGEGFCYFSMPQHSVNVGDQYQIRIRAESEGEAVAVLRAVSFSNNELLHEMKITGADPGNDEAAYTLAYEILDGDCASLKYSYFAVIAGIYVCLIVSFLLLLIKPKKEYRFVSLIFVVGLLYLLVLPPYTVPDEGAHFITVYSESSALLNETALNDQGQVILGPESADFLLRQDNPSKSSYVNYIRGIFGRDGDVAAGTVSSRKPLTTSHLGYIPQILGVTAGRLLSLNGEWIFLSGRLFALIWYCFLMFFAMKRMPEFGKNILFVVGLLPMTMQMAVSYNYDSVLFGASFFLISYMLYLAYDAEKTKIGWKDCLILFFLIAVIVPVKVVYLPLVGLGLLIPREKFGGIVRKAECGGGLLLGGVLVFVLARTEKLGDIAAKSAGVQASSATYTLADCLADPAGTGILYLRTTLQNLTEYMEGAVGASLGWLDLEVPRVIIYGFVLLLFFSVLQSGQGQRVWERWQRVWLAVLIGGTVFLVYFALLIDFTPEGSMVIGGIQGRYFIPILPLCLCAVQNQRIVLRKNLDTLLTGGTAVLQITTLMSVMSVIMSR